MPRPHKIGYLDSAAVLLALTFLAGSPSFALTDPAPSDDAPQAATAFAVESDAQASPKADGAKQASAKLVESYGKIPLHFEPNQGQTDAQVKFLARGPGYALFLTPTDAVLSLTATKRPEGEARDPRDRGPLEQALVRMHLEGANPKARIEGLEPLPGKSNYLVGNDLKKWRTDISNYAKVRYKEIYPGIDLVFYGNPRQLEYDFVVKPGADPAQIRLQLTSDSAPEGAKAAELQDGNLVLRTALGELRFNKPILYQEADGARHEIAGGFVLLPAQGDEANKVQRLGFEVAAYDANRPLTIDPTLVYSTYLGGNLTDIGWAIAVDSSGNAYVTGQTASVAFPCAPSGSTPAPAWVSPACPSGVPADLAFLPRPKSTGTDIIITKLNSTGSALVYSTHLGGSGVDIGWAIAVDGSGNAYVTGETSSSNFPCVPAVTSLMVDCPAADKTDATLPRKLFSGVDAFVAKINSTGNALTYSTYLGGSGTDIGYGIAVDGSGNAYVTGETDSTPTAAPGTTANFPCLPAVTSGSVADCPAVQPAAPTLPRTRSAGGVIEAFVAKINSAGTALLYSTYLGGAIGTDRGYAIALDGSGNAYVTGRTDSTDFPTWPSPALYGANAGGIDAFVAKINNTTPPALGFSTYLGSAGTDIGWGIKVDSSSNVYVAGETAGVFPTLNAAQPVIGGGIDAFVTKINSGGASLAYSTYLGGSGTDIGFAIAVDGGGKAHVTGRTSSSAATFPLVTPIQGINQGGVDAFITKFTSTGTFQYSTFYGGGGTDIGNAIAVDSSCNAYVTGSTLSGATTAPPSLTTTAPTGFTAYDSGCGTDTPADCDAGAASDAFVLKIQPDSGDTCSSAPPPPGNPTLTIDGLGTGTGTVSATTPTISCTSTAGADTGTCSGTVTSGNTVTLTAAAASGSTFAGWTGGGGTCASAPTVSPCITAAITTNTTVQATFTSPAITVTGAGTGTGTVSATTPTISCTSTAGVTTGTCVAQVTSGNMVTLTAVAAPGSTFGGWTGTATGSCTGTISSCTTAAITTSTTVQATFTSTTPPPGGGPFNLTASTSGASGIILSGDSKIVAFSGTSPCGPLCLASYASGTGVALNAIAQVDSIFSSWTAGPCSGLATNPCTATMSAATTATANFATSADIGGPRVTATVNGLPGTGNVITSSPVSVQYTLRQCATELYVLVNAPPMGIGWSYLNSAGTAIAVPAALSGVTPYRVLQGDGVYSLFSGPAPLGIYELLLACDSTNNGGLTVDPSLVFTRFYVTVQ